MAASCCRMGRSSNQLHRALQRSAWFLMRRRRVMARCLSLRVGAWGIPVLAPSIVDQEVYWVAV